MLSEIELRKEEVVCLCRRFHVRRLELFGSAAISKFRGAESDIDFLVDFMPGSGKGYADCYFGLLESLEALFQCPVDLLVATAIKNPYFRESVDRTRVVLYAA